MIINNKIFKTMSREREQVESYKKMVACNPVERMNLGMDDFLPKDVRMCGYLEQQRAYAIALDKAVARKLNVELNDFEEFYRDKSVEEAEAWAKELPDMPRLSYSSSRSGVFS